MTLPYTDPDGYTLNIVRSADRNGRPALELLISDPADNAGWRSGSSVQVPEETLRAGIRDAARQAAGQTPTTEHTCPDGEPCPAHDEPVVEQPAEAQPADLLARVHAWIASEPVTARSEFGSGYREALRDISDVITGRQTVEETR